MQLPDLANLAVSPRDMDDSYVTHAAMRLPPELLDAILYNLGKFQDIAACALVCSAWSTRALKYLYIRDQAGPRYAIRWALLNNRAATISRITTMLDDPFRLEDVSTAIIMDNDAAVAAMLVSDAVLREWRLQDSYDEDQNRQSSGADKYGRAPLTAAVARRNRRLVEQILALVGAGLSVHNVHHWTALNAACTSRQPYLDAIASSYKNYGYTHTEDARMPRDRIDKPTADLGIARALLAAGLDPNQAIQTQAISPLFLAAEANHLELMELLLSYGADINCGERDSHEGGLTPLLGACQADHVDAVRFLLERGADVFCTNISNLAALHLANNFEVLQLILDAGMPPDYSMELSSETTERRQGRLPRSTPLGEAIERGNKEKARFLLSKGADPRLYTGGGLHTPLELAIKGGMVDLIPDLCRAGAHPHDEEHTGPTALDCAVLQDSVAAAEMLLEYGADFTRLTDIVGREVGSVVWTTLSRKRPICFARSVEMVDFLLGHSGSLNDRIGDNGETAFQLAVVCQQSDRDGEQATRQIVTRLFESDADIDIDMACYSGCTALSFAARACAHVVVDQLALLGADVNKPENSGWTPLMWACRRKNFATLAALLKHGADVLATKPIEVYNGVELPVESALDVAARFNFAGGVKALANAGADLDRTNAKYPDSLTIRRLVVKRDRAQRKQVRRDKRMAAKRAAQAEAIPDGNGDGTKASYHQ